MRSSAMGLPGSGLTALRAASSRWSSRCWLWVYAPVPQSRYAQNSIMIRPAVMLVSPTARSVARMRPAYSGQKRQLGIAMPRAWRLSLATLQLGLPKSLWTIRKPRPSAGVTSAQVQGSQEGGLHPAAEVAAGQGQPALAGTHDGRGVDHRHPVD